MRWNKDNLKRAISSSETKAETIRNLGLRPLGGNRSSLNKYIEKYEIDISHFKELKITPLEEVLEGKHPEYPRYALKKSLLKRGILKNECSVCGNKGFHNGKPLRMWLDHINGVNNDHRIKNLRMICPNCETQSDTYSGRDKFLKN